MVYDPKKISYEQLLKTFWENHDPTQGMRQGNDVGTQYRSGIYATTPAQKKAAEASKAMFGKALAAKRYGAITTEILDAPPFYFAEDYHQQYLAKNPIGYCGLGGTGVSCPIGTGVARALSAAIIRSHYEGAASAALFIYGVEQQQAEHQEHDAGATAPCSMLVRSPPNVSDRHDRVTASSTICSWSSPSMVGVSFITPRTSTAGMVRPMVASTEPSEMLTARCKRLRSVACNAPIASGASTSTATMTPTSACGALASFTACSTMWPSCSVR